MLHLQWSTTQNTNDVPLHGPQLPTKCRWYNKISIDVTLHGPQLSNECHRPDICKINILHPRQQGRIFCHNKKFYSWSSVSWELYSRITMHSLSPESHQHNNRNVPSVILCIHHYHIQYTRRKPSPKCASPYCNTQEEWLKVH